MKILIFENVHALLRAEKILNAAKIHFEVLPTPKQYSSECGMCLALSEDQLDITRTELNALTVSVFDDPREASE